MFYSKSFIFDGVISETYDLRILNFDTSSGLSESSVMGEVELIQSWPLKRSSPYHFGVAKNNPLEFEVSIGSYNPLTASDKSKIMRWLVGRNQYKKFSVVEDDRFNGYYNVIFKYAGLYYIGNIAYGVKLMATCDAPWGWTYPATRTFSFDGDSLQNYDINFYNDSDNDDYLYPLISFTLSNNINSTYFTLINNSDSGRIFQFTNLNVEEAITIDNDRKIITSSLDELRLGNFNKNWFRLVPGINKLNLVGYLTDLSMTYSFARKIGA